MFAVQDNHCAVLLLMAVLFSLGLTACAASPPARLTTGEKQQSAPLKFGAELLAALPSLADFPLPAGASLDQAKLSLAYPPSGFPSAVLAKITERKRGEFFTKLWQDHPGVEEPDFAPEKRESP